MSTDGNNNLSPLSNKYSTKFSQIQEARRFIRLRSPEKELREPPVFECICQRKIMGILCRSCGETFRGRVRKMCLMHPTSRYLMDYEVCPSCTATQLQEFDEPVPVSDLNCDKERSG